MDNYSKYLKYKTKYFELKNNLENIKQVGGSNFSSGQRIITKSGNKGTIVKQASSNEFGLDLNPFLTSYVVDFDEGYTKTYNDAYNVSNPNGTYSYVVEERDMKPVSSIEIDDVSLSRHLKTGDYAFVPIKRVDEGYRPYEVVDGLIPGMPSKILKDCRFNFGDKVSVSKANITFINPTRIEFIGLKVGRISSVLPRSEYTNPPYKCLYEITFSDGSIATEIDENYIKKYSGTIKILSPIPGTNLMSEIESDTDDLLTAIAINNINESIRDSSRISYLESPRPKYDIDYQDIGEDKNLQNEISKFFHKKTIKWLTSNHEFAKLKKHKKFISSKKGLPYVFKLLKLYVKKNGINWYELRNEENYDEVKEYIRNKLSSI